MKNGALVTGLVAAFAIGAVVVAFSANASPYVTIAQARVTSGDHLHLAGDVVKETLHSDPFKRQLSFDLKDASGAVMHVVHIGEMPSNLGEVKKVVAVGGMKGTDFVSTQLLVKCPSKYEADTSSKVAQN
ncbi:MAG TPA: cytochrome c maturation protein CcmE [Verrucomicrobiae bacterium]|nr:cytochrome c maturation protein CcmE [Verrucomicrobiae bacterium]